MSTKGMKALLADLGKDVAERIEVPADAELVMAEFCQAMSRRKQKPVDLVFREFPPEMPVSGLRLVMSDRSLIVIPAGMNTQAQLVVLGHELFHEEENHCSHSLPGLGAAARALPDSTSTVQAIERAAELVIASEEVPREALIAVAARADSSHIDEERAETYGILFASEVRGWVKGRHARSQADAATVEGRLKLSMSHTGGRIL